MTLFDNNLLDVGFDYEQSHRYLNESIQKMEEAINVQQEEMLSARHLRDENYDVFTNYLSPDRLLAPAVVMSHFLTAKAETSFLGHAYNAGINLQTGVIITGRDAELDILSETQRVIDKSVRTLESHSRNTLAEHLSQQTLDSGGTGNVTNAAHFEVLASVSSTFSHRSLLQTAEPLLSATEFPTIYSAVMPGSPSGALVEAPALLLDATKAEKFTLRSELFPVDKDLSITEVDYWIQWALAQGGIGLGFMLGSGVILDVEQSKMLTKIRFRLVDLYGRKDVRIDDGRKLLLLAALCKLSAQLRLIEEVGKYLVKFEDVVEVYGDPYYHAISRRFRLDYADWTDLYVKESSSRPSEDEAQDLDTNVDMTDAGEADAAAVTIPILMRKMQLAKEYYKLAELTLDIHLRRDSMKRVMNSFTEISLSMTVEHMEVISEEEEELSRRSSLKKLQFFTAKEIDLYEKTDPIWVKQFSYARAQQFATMLSKTCK